MTTSRTLAATKNGIDPLKLSEPSRGRLMEVCYSSSRRADQPREGGHFIGCDIQHLAAGERGEEAVQVPPRGPSRATSLAQPGVKMKLTSMSFLVTRAWASANLPSSLAGASVNTKIDERGRLCFNARTMAPNVGSLQSLAPVAMRSPTAAVNSVAFFVTNTEPGSAE